MSTQTITRAAQMLEQHAAELKSCHTLEDCWGDEDDARAAYDAEMALAAELRAMLAAPEAPAQAGHHRPERAPSPTAGMSLGERIEHVGGRVTADGRIEFGSAMAVNALVAQVMRDLPVQPTVELRRIREHLHCENGGDLIAAIDMLRSWEADANRRADTLADHLRWVIEIARTWQPDYATDRDLADIAGAEEALNGKTKTAQPADVARLVEALDWIDDFIARCNGDDRGACEAVNRVRAALAAHGGAA